MIDIFEREVTCKYRGETYQVRDNGAILRKSREGKRKRPKDDIWTFGNVVRSSGYLRFVSEAVHRIVATAFHGEPSTSRNIVDHIDTNRQNNRPENLRWVNRLENLILNPITLSRILYNYGSIDNFFANPSKPRSGELNQDFSWMRTVSKEEAENTKENLLLMGRKGTIGREGALGEWIYSRIYVKEPERSSEDALFESLTRNAVQKKWKTPSEFPLCPVNTKGTALVEYCQKLIPEAVFARDKYKHSKVVSAEISEVSGELFVMCNYHPSQVKDWSLAKVYINDNLFVHESLGTYFRLDGAQKEFTIALGLEWEGGETFDDAVS